VIRPWLLCQFPPAAAVAVASVPAQQRLDRGLRRRFGDAAEARALERGRSGGKAHLGRMRLALGEREGKPSVKDIASGKLSGCSTSRPSFEKQRAGVLQFLRSPLKRHPRFRSRY